MQLNKNQSTEWVDIYDQNGSGRTLICGDLHGEYDLLQESLQLLKFDKTKDKLFCTGDLVDRGQKNLEVARLLNHDWFFSVVGNHDQMCMDGINDESWKRNHLHPSNGGDWFYELSEEERKEIIGLFSNMPYVIEINAYGERYGIIHGNIHVDDWIDIKKAFNQSNEEYLKMLKYNCIWGRDRINKGGKGYEKVKNVDVVFHGHTIVEQPGAVNNCFYIDTGAYATKNITFAEITKDGILITNTQGLKHGSIKH